MNVTLGLPECAIKRAKLRWGVESVRRGRHWYWRYWKGTLKPGDNGNRE